MLKIKRADRHRRVRDAVLTSKTKWFRHVAKNYFPLKKRGKQSKL